MEQPCMLHILYSHITYTVNTMPAEALVTEVARASAGIVVLTK